MYELYISVTLWLLAPSYRLLANKIIIEGLFVKIKLTKGYELIYRGLFFWYCAT